MKILSKILYVNYFHGFCYKNHQNILGSLESVMKFFISKCGIIILHPDCLVCWVEGKREGALRLIIGKQFQMVTHEETNLGLHRKH